MGISLTRRLATLLIAVGIGVGVDLLIASASGEETRAEMTKFQALRGRSP
jgi:hypothetical protein